MISMSCFGEFFWCQASGILVPAIEPEDDRIHRDVNE